MSWRNLKLPPYDVVVTWDVSNVQEWLKNSDLNDFVTFAQDTNLNGISLLELDETIIFNKNLVDISVSKRKQLAKCVKECKNQASQAKKQISKCINDCKVQANHCKNAVNNTLKTKKQNGFKASKTDSNDHEESDYSGNEWGTDFEESDDEDASKNPDVERISPVREPRLVTENKLQSTPRQNGASKIGSYDMQNINQDQNSDEIALPKDSNSVVLTQIKRYSGEVDEMSTQPVLKPKVSPKPNLARMPVIPKPPTTNFHELKSLTTPLATASSTLTRPKTNPPAPPVKPAPSPVLPPPEPVNYRELPSEVPPNIPPFQIEEEEYLTPLQLQAPINQNGMLVTAYPAFASYQSSNSSTTDSQDNYEIISNPDDSGNGSSFEFGNNENQELARKQALALSHEFRFTRNLNNPTPQSLPMVQAGPVTIDSSLTPPLPQKTTLKSKSSISSLQNKINGIKISISRSNYASNSNPKPLPPKPDGMRKEVVSSPDNGFTSFPSNQSNEKLNRPLPGLPPVLSKNNEKLKEDSLEQQPYFQDIERDKAARLVLSLGQDGAFLVRPSRQGGVNNPFTITLVQSGKAYHLNVRNNKGKYALGKEKPLEKVFDTVPAMISYHREIPIYVTSQECMGKECFLRISPTKH